VVNAVVVFAVILSFVVAAFAAVAFLQLAIFLYNDMYDLVFMQQWKNGQKQGQKENLSWMRKREHLKKRNW
jgi:hypothetical protein